PPRQGRHEMTASHTHLTPDLPPVVETPDLPGAQHPRAAGESGPEDGAGHGRGAHRAEHDGRHESAGQDSGG
ncbi:hypothetical protein ACSNOH_33440, partial [Streptomyces sp. URMC 127]|uniref:hypothetical protein n=1 Tax=Streptomyces sp. URMC 127 TaxID=3423402 RepID=UPI003F1B82C1